MEVHVAREAFCSKTFLDVGAILVYVPDRLFGHYRSVKSEQTCC